MKKRILLSTIIAGFSYVVFSSHSGGLAYIGGLNRTGAQGSSTTCGTIAAGCHGGTSATTAVTITVDSGTTSTAVTHYVPGDVYTIKIHGTNSVSNPKFGFQFASVSGTGVAQVQAGACSGLPSNVASDPLSGSGLSIIEQSATLTATTAGVYDVSFTWTAPTTGVGNISLYCTLNAVNGDDIANAADYSNSTSVVLGQEAKPNAVGTLVNAVQVRAFPNPAVNLVNLGFENALPGNYSVSVYDLSGRCIQYEVLDISGGSEVIALNSSNWMPGVYQLVIANEGNSQVIPVVKR